MVNINTLLPVSCLLSTAVCISVPVRGKLDLERRFVAVPSGVVVNVTH